MQARREAAAHLPVGRRVLAARQRAPAVAQAEQRVELLDQLGGGRPPPHRADADGVAGGGLARDLEDRERDVQPAAQVDVAVGLGLAAHVARRAQRLDQPVLEQQRAELGLRDLVVDVLGLGRPRRADGEVRARARAQVDRLAHVQRPPVGVAEDVDARLVRQVGQVRALAARALDLRRPRADLARAQHARARRRPSARWPPGARRARRTRARTCARPGSARWTSSTSTPSAAASVASPRRRCSGAKRRAIETVQITGGAGHSSAARANAWRSTRTSKAALWATSTRPRSSSATLRQHLLGRRRGVDHRLRDAREALDPAPERVRDADQRVPLVVQLAPADEHRRRPRSARSARPPDPLVSVSSAMNSVVANVCSSMDRAASPHGPDGATSLAVPLPFADVRRLAPIVLLAVAGRLRRLRGARERPAPARPGAS